MSGAVEMQELLERWEHSGQSQRAFADQEGVSYSQFLYWRRRLRQAPVVKRRKRRAAPVVLTPVRIIPDARLSTAGFELRTPGGLTVSVPPGFDELELRRLLDSLVGC